jgi:hypothetical protein
MTIIAWPVCDEAEKILHGSFLGVKNFVNRFSRSLHSKNDDNA